MARIRTIKPEFWTDEKLATVSESSRLLAIALLNYADDEGYFNANTKLIMAACCPLVNPKMSVEKSIEELKNIGYLSIRDSQNGTKIGLISNFAKHQKINRPTPSKLSAYYCKPGEKGEKTPPQGEFNEDSMSPPQKYPQEQGTGNREQGTGKGEGENGMNAEPPLFEIQNHFLVDKIKNEFPNVYGLKTKLTNAEAERLCAEFDLAIIFRALEKMENRRRLTKDCVSTNLTLRNYIGFVLEEKNGKSNQKTYGRVTESQIREFVAGPPPALPDGY